MGLKFAVHCLNLILKYNQCERNRIKVFLLSFHKCNIRCEVKKTPTAFVLTNYLEEFILNCITTVPGFTFLRYGKIFFSRLLKGLLIFIGDGTGLKMGNAFGLGTFKTWKQAQKTGFVEPYRATNKTWIIDRYSM